MGSKLVHHKYTMDKICPLCKKQVKAIIIERKKVSVHDSDWQNEIQTLGCPECRNVFFYEEAHPFMKEQLKKI